MNDSLISRFLESNKKILLFILLTIIVFIVGFFSFNYLKTSKSKNAVEVLDKLEEAYSSFISTDKDVEKKEEALKYIEELTSKFKNTYYSQKAYVTAGLINIEEEEVSNAIENFEKASLEKETYLSAFINMNLGFLYGEEGNLDKAEEFLSKSIVDKNPQKSRVMFLLARIYEEKKEFEKAKEQYEKIIKDYINVYKNLSESRLLSMEIEGLI